ncbi:MAG: hypothetical protein EA424_06120 [Planctomycetaceae bacterium]|nr:MAG: hypothetical protein EA424_06120 [Planctomycetaceae bacterium]
MPAQDAGPEPISNPHDAYAKSVFREISQARGFFRGYLPDEVCDLFDWRTLRLETASFVSDEHPDGRAAAKRHMEPASHVVQRIRSARAGAADFDAIPGRLPDDDGGIGRIGRKRPEGNRSRAIGAGDVEDRRRRPSNGVVAIPLDSWRHLPEFLSRPASPGTASRVILLDERDGQGPGGRSTSGVAVDSGRIPAS